MMIVSPDTQANRTRLVPLVREMPADFETPISAYLKLKDEQPSFLLESVTGGEQVARYSFIGISPSKTFIVRDGRIECHNLDGTGETWEIPYGMDVLDALRGELHKYDFEPIPGLPRFAGGLVGYLGYDSVRGFESTVKLEPHATLPEAIYMLADSLVAFDHAFGKMLLIAIAHMDSDEAAALDEAEQRLDAMEARLKSPIPANGHGAVVTSADKPLRSNMSRERYMQIVEQAREYIAAGEIFQVVLSQRLSRETQAGPFHIYRALRRVNPSPYMYFLNFGSLLGEEPLYIIGASPELHVRLEGSRASVRPIAGTRRRGATRAEDARLESELLADPKERAEHLMLVDLGRNDLGRVCEFGSVSVPEFMTVEQYSHVMHIVSQVEGDLRREYDAFDLLRATFPAGTVSGAPKIRAMQIIEELEQDPRGPYAGVVGYFSFDGSLDTCITIRTLVMRGKRVEIQSGAGIVADSDPEREYLETMSKAQALATAIDLAESEARSAADPNRGEA